MFAGFFCLFFCFNSGTRVGYTHINLTIYPVLKAVELSLALRAPVFAGLWAGIPSRGLQAASYLAFPTKFYVNVLLSCDYK